MTKFKNFLKLTSGTIYDYLNTVKFFKKKNNKNNNILNEINKNGFYIIDNFFSEDKCNKIKEKIDNFINSGSKLIYFDEKISDSRIYGSEFIDRDISEYKDNKLIREICSDYLKCEVDCLMTMANRIVFKKDNEGSGGGWHRDSIYRQFKSILYLENVENVNGPFQFIKDSNKFWKKLSHTNILKKKINDTRFKNDEIDSLINKKNLQKMSLVGKKGTLILVDTSLIHRGSPIQNEKRYALTNYLYPKKTIHQYYNHFNPRIKNYSDIDANV